MNRQIEKDNIFQIISFYHFTPFSKAHLKKMYTELMEEGIKNNIVGLILLSKEGINATLSGKEKDINNYLQIIEKQTQLKTLFYKKSPSPISGFKKLRIKIKKEIITFRKKGSSASFGFHNLEPEEWEAMLNEKQVTVLDIRNDYEIELGQFKNATNLKLKEFNEFSKKLPSAHLPKEQKTLLYCTGGIRCEKAITEMEKQGFKEVYQLKGGIIHYLKSFPNKSFKGECFVFDHRVAVDQHLNPSQKYDLCPHCGQAAGKKIICNHCGKHSKVCKHCIEKNIDYLLTCSKNCAHHFRLKHQCKKTKNHP